MRLYAAIVIVTTLTGAVAVAWLICDYMPWKLREAVRRRFRHQWRDPSHPLPHVQALRRIQRQERNRA